MDSERIFTVLRRLENVPDRQEKFWNVSPQTGNFLNILTRSVGARSILEIGTSNGYSGLWFTEALSHTGGKLYTVESHKERFVLAGEHFTEAGAGEYVEQIFGHAPELFSTQDFRARGTHYDIIFLDATKMEYESYLEAVFPFLKTGGLLIADNVISHAEDLKGFLAYVRQKQEFRSEVLPLGSGLLLALKTV